MKESFVCISGCHLYFYRLQNFNIRSDAFCNQGCTVFALCKASTLNRAFHLWRWHTIIDPQVALCTSWTVLGPHHVASRPSSPASGDHIAWHDRHKILKIRDSSSMHVHLEQSFSAWIALVTVNAMQRECLVSSYCGANMNMVCPGRIIYCQWRTTNLQNATILRQIRPTGSTLSALAVLGTLQLRPCQDSKSCIDPSVSLSITIYMDVSAASHTILAP